MTIQRFGISKRREIGFNAGFSSWISDDPRPLRDDQWDCVKGFMPSGTKGRRGPPTDNKLFVDVLLWMARSGGRWRDLPCEYGHCQSVKRRYYQWIEMGVLDGILSVLAQDADLDWVMVDSTIVRAHQHAAGARKAKGGGADAQGMGRSRGGLSTIHAAGDALGCPVRLIGTPGQRNDITLAPDLIDGLKAGAVIADKGYDTDGFVQTVTATRAEVIIPPKRNRKTQRPYDVHLYRERNAIERFFCKLLAER